MSHGIKERDAVLVPTGEENRTWHGLETAIAGEITPRVAHEHGVFPYVRRAEIIANLNGAMVPMPNYRGLVAETFEGDLVPIHVASDKYAIIQNREIAKTLSEALKRSGVDYKLSAIGTLGNLSKFFMSFEIAKDQINGEDHVFYMNGLGSHDGSMQGRFLGSDVRPVCQNTVNASRFGKKKVVDCTIAHKGNVPVKLAALVEHIHSLIEDRKYFKDDMESLAQQKVSRIDVAPIVSGYFIKTADKPIDTFSTRRLNTIQSITDLAFDGRGNRGETLYDVFNGATEYWTSGDGVGRKTSNSNKAFSSEFGTAAAHKRGFTEYLLSDDKDQYIERGLDVLSATLSA